MRPEDYRRFRTYVADGALLLFRPSTGDAIRVAAPGFRHLRARAPRAVFVGLSHACNLECWFCSRDAQIRHRWTAGDIVKLLGELSGAGTLEVAFGGGEPLAYAGFIDVLQRLAEETALALHFTTNGTLIDESVASRLAPLVGEVRVSIYESSPWERAIRYLRGAGIQVGANVLVRRDNVGGLPALLSTLRSLGCDNVALLRYVGPEQGSHLAGSDWLDLEHAIRTAAVTIRLSRCFADRMPTIPRFAWSQDCGAGRDFVVIDPDAHMRPCSFHQRRHGFVSAQDLLASFEASGSPVPALAEGCARPVQPLQQDEASVHFLRGFASNNSGDTVLVARFETAREPAELLERLAGLDSETDRDAWRQFLSAEGCSPDGVHFDPVVSAVGRTLLATGYDSDDALYGLREVVTRRGARVVHTAVHTHQPPTLLVGAAPSADSDFEKGLWVAGADEVQRHGGALFATFPPEEGGSWQNYLSEAQRAVEGAPLAAELVAKGPAERLVDGCKVLVNEDSPGFFQGWFYKPEIARTFAESVDQRTAQAGATVILPVSRFRKRLALRAHQAGGIGCWLPKGSLALRATFFHRDYRKGHLLPETVAKAIQESSGFPSKLALTKSHRATVAKLVTSDPLPVLEEIERIAATLDVAVSVNATPSNPMAHALGRVKTELSVLR